jgi:ABC-type branched-subunit amino acid transport system substrate-binding protein
VPLTRPGWVGAGQQHLLAGLELAVSKVNDGGRIAGRPPELVVRDTEAPASVNNARDQYT